MLKLFGYISLFKKFTACSITSTNYSTIMSGYPFLSYTNLPLKFVFALVIPISVSFAYVSSSFLPSQEDCSPSVAINVTHSWTSLYFLILLSFLKNPLAFVIIKVMLNIIHIFTYNTIFFIKGNSVYVSIWKL